MPDGLVGHLAAFAGATRARPLSPSLTESVQRTLLDLLGVAVAGSGESPVASVREVATRRGGREEATVLVTGERLPAAAAAMVNGTMAHALDFDDTHLPSVLHPSASVAPAVLAAAEAHGVPGADLLTAVAVGNEIACRLGMAAYDPALRNSVFFERGFHATSICGAVGAAAGASLVSGADTETMAHALAIAASLGSGILEANRTGGTVKPFHCGWAAQAGITAVELAGAAMTGPPTAIEGRFGFFESHTGGFDQGRLIGGLGEHWEISRLFIKPYPTNHFTHAGIDAAMALRAQGVCPDEIQSLELGVPEPVLRTIAEPPDEKARPRSGHHAKFSGPFTVAAALLGGGGLGVALSDFTDESVRDPRRLDLAARVVCVVDDEASRVFPHQLPAVLRATLRDGAVWEHRVEHTRGGPERPLTDEDLGTKVSLNVEPVLGAASVSGLRDAVAGLPSAGSVSELLAAATK